MVSSYHVRQHRLYNISITAGRSFWEHCSRIYTNYLSDIYTYLFNRQLKPNVSETILYLFIPPRLFSSYPNPNHVIFLESGCTIQYTTYPVTMAKISVILNSSFFTPIQTATNSHSFPSVASTPSLHLHRYYLSSSTHHCFPELTVLLIKSACLFHPANLVMYSLAPYRSTGLYMPA